MAKEPVQITTKFSMQEVGELFRRAMRVSWFSENISGAGTQFEKPPVDAFNELNQDQPHFSVMALLGGRGADIQKSAVYMYAWDRGDHVDIVMFVGKNLGALGLKSRSKMKKFIGALQAADPTTEYVGL